MDSLRESICGVEGPLHFHSKASTHWFCCAQPLYLDDRRPYPLPPPQQIAKRLAFRPYFIGEVRTLFDNIRKPFLRLIRPLGNRIPRVAVRTPQILPDLPPRLRSKQQTQRRAYSKSNQQKFYSCPRRAIRAFIFSSLHN